jgi:hypothetical protein
MYPVQDPFTCLPHDCEITADGSLFVFVSTYRVATGWRWSMSPYGVLRHVLCASSSLNVNQEQVTNLNEIQNLLARGDPCRHVECYVTSCVPVNATSRPFIAFVLTLSRNQFLGSEKKLVLARNVCVAWHNWMGGEFSETSVAVRQCTACL